MSSNEADTKPTIETVLERIADFRESVEMRFKGLESRIDGFESKVEAKFEDFEVKFDRMDSMVHATRADMLSLRVEFREVGKDVREMKLQLSTGQ
jgi:flagellar capping protein FliD